MSVLLAEGNALETNALQTIVGGAGARVDIVTDSRNIVEAAKRLSPSIILIDTAMTGLDLTHVEKILTRNPATADAALLLVAPLGADARKMRMLKEHDAFALMSRPMTCSAIRETFDNAARFYTENRDMRGGTRSAGGSKKLVAGCSALLRKELSCPFHSFGVPVDFFQLRTGKVYSETDLFDVPSYKPGGRGEEGFVDYNLAGLAICRECFFATSDPGYFEDPEASVDGTVAATYRIDEITRRKIIETSGHRGLTAVDRLGAEPDDAFFGWQRDVRHALVAYEVAIQTSRTLYEAAPIRRSNELLRLGGYELRRATLLEGQSTPGARVIKHRTAAVAWLTKAFGECKGVAMYKAAYQLVALNIHLGRDAHAFQFLNTLREQTRLSIRDQEDPATLERYLRRSQTVWEDRDRHRHADVAAAGATKSAGRRAA